MRLVGRIFTKTESVSVRERVAHPLARLQTQQKKIEHICMQLKRRDNDLFKKCVEMHQSGDKLRTQMYADECAEIRKIARHVLGSQLALERVIVRLETIMHFGDIVTKDMAAVVSLVGGIKEKMSSVIPSVANELHHANTALTNMVTTMGQATPFQQETVAIRDETQKVLIEAASIADQRMREQYAELPSTETISETTRAAVTNANRTGLPELQNIIYNYAINRGDGFNAAKCAAELGISQKTVEHCLERLVEQGRLSFERQ